MLRTSRFFVLRTPALPFETIEGLAEGLRSSELCRDPLLGVEERAALFLDEKMRVQSRLRALVDRPEIREALYLASPSLEDNLASWRIAPNTARNAKVEWALARYLFRMAGRATPFGLFAGCLAGRFESPSKLTLSPLSASRRHLRLDLGLVCQLAESLALQHSVREQVRFNPNPSLIQSETEARYIRSDPQGEERRFNQASVEMNEVLATVLSEARQGASFSDLALRASAALERMAVPQSSPEELRRFIHRLIDQQLLLPDILPPLTGEPQLDFLLARTEASTGLLAEVAAVLRETQATMGSLARQPLGVAPGTYRAAVEKLTALPVEVSSKRTLQVDLLRSAESCTLSTELSTQVREAVELLHRIFHSPAETVLSAFKARFLERYEYRQIPLMDALDPELGLGFGAPDNEPLLPERDRLLAKLLQTASLRKLYEVDLGPETLSELEPPRHLPLPDAFGALASLTSLDPKTCQVVLVGAAGPSGAKVLGRFCEGDPRILAGVLDHLRMEEQSRPEAIYAEVVHLSVPRMANLTARPILRAYEIPLMGRSGLPAERQIRLEDLYLSVRGGRLVLWSRKLNKEVIPRITNAQGVREDFQAYNFFRALAAQGVCHVVRWDWGTNADVPFLPRIRSGRAVFSLAKWNLSREQISQLSQGDELTRFSSMQRLREELGLPRWVQLADGDNLLSVDLNNPVIVESLIQLIKRRPRALISEMFPGPDELCVTGEEGRFVHELWMLFNSTAPEAAPGPSPHPPPPPTKAVTRCHPPGSEWLYLKIYCGAATADRVLRRGLDPLIEELLNNDRIERWFFLRYADPDPHLRLRFKGQPLQLTQEVLPRLRDALTPWLHSGAARDLSVETYYPELERYGGADSIAWAEALFEVDSELVLGALRRSSGEEGTAFRWKLCLLCMDGLLNDFALELPDKLRFVTHRREAFFREQGAGRSVEIELSKKFRAMKDELRGWFTAETTRQGDDHSVAWDLNRWRSDRNSEPVAVIRARAAAGQLSVSLDELMSSLLHMQVNRMIRTAPRQEELVLYDFLSRIYRSELARQPSQAKSLE